MKRVYLLLTLFMTSFFLLSSNVKADVLTYEINQTEIDYLYNENFIEIREKAIEYCNENNKNYFIFPYGNVFRVYIFDNSLYNMYFDNDLDLIYKSYPFFNYDTFAIRDGVFTRVSGGSYATIILINNGKINFEKFLDSNISSINFNGTVPFTIKYNDLELTINPGDKVPSLYEFINQEEPDIHEEEKIKIFNFYSLIIEKIKLLTNYIATDYIILSALVIFIFVAVIGLVRRLK